MAKRKRLTPANPGALDTPSPVLETKSMPFPAPRAPIAQVAGEAASAAALEELAGKVQRARDEGRMIQPLPLEAIETDYLQRDRIAADTAELQELTESIRARGQQTPIEVVALEEGRFGLISGWRRLTALRRLRDETGEARFGQVNAILRKPNTAAEAYVAMVEENEIRLGLSYYERARIAAKAVAQGVYPAEKIALQELFKTASRAKRSKIGAFLTIYHALDSALRFPNAIGERFGITLSHALADEAGLADRLSETLQKAAPSTAEEELDLLRSVSVPAHSVSNPTLEDHKLQAVQGPDQEGEAPTSVPSSAAKPAMRTIGLTRSGRDRILLAGPAATLEFQARLIAWLDTQGLKPS